MVECIELSTDVGLHPFPVCSGKETMEIWDSYRIPKQRHYFANKDLFSQSYGFSSSHVWTGELDYKKADHQTIDAFELWWWRKYLRVPWIGKEIQPVNPKGNQSWIFIGRTDAEAETPILWPPDAKN